MTHRRFERATEFRGAERAGRERDVRYGRLVSVSLAHAIAQIFQRPASLRNAKASEPVSRAGLPWILYV